MVVQLLELVLKVQKFMKKLLALALALLMCLTVFAACAPEEEPVETTTTAEPDDGTTTTAEPEDDPADGSTTTAKPDDVLTEPLMWNEKKDVVTNLSFDRLATSDSEGNAGVSIFKPGRAAHWDGVADISDSRKDHLRFIGWLNALARLAAVGYTHLDMAFDYCTHPDFPLMGEGFRAWAEDLRRRACAWCPFGTTARPWRAAWSIRWTWSARI